MAQCFRFGWRRCSPLNWALVANEENAAKTKYIGLRCVCFWLGFRISIPSYLVFVKIERWFLLWLDFLFQKPIHLLRVSSVISSF
ncbi:hypothetical protein FDE04_25085 [Vibrio parahaemolyticus]|nr:hypothetical protein [Vibrio parahaemolyticus]EGR3441788.1 hypothetical protein [Vibrio parahaemolyticus]MQC42610.1 hypothetical protein [Vibrio parahaemolyticus]MQC67801.1 hypothetical protein [Vibrio parahaemolyticus]MQD16884.1 hypothetical protein [Vibrio parahaemolyticus]